MNRFISYCLVPTGIATQDPERQKALVVEDKAERVYNFHKNSLHALKELLQAAGVEHPDDLKPHHIVRRVSANEISLLSNLLQFLEEGDLVKGDYKYPVFKNWFEKSSTEKFGFK